MRTDARSLLFPSIVAILAFVGAEAFPAYRYYLWSIAAFVLAWSFYRELQKPVNYLALEVNDEGFLFKLSETRQETAKWTEIVDVYFTRMFDDNSNDYDTEWEIHTSEGVKTVLVEWPHRKLFLLALGAHVPNFDGAPAELALRDKQEGRWQCYHI
jgi:hypothetical protein